MNSEYERLGEAIADTMFDSAFAGQPVYVLPDSETLNAILTAAGVMSTGTESCQANAPSGRDWCRPISLARKNGYSPQESAVGDPTRLAPSHAVGFDG